MIQNTDLLLLQLLFVVSSVSPLFCYAGIYKDRHSSLRRSRSIHSHMYGGQFRSSIPSVWRFLKKFTASTSTCVTSSRSSTTNGGPSSIKDFSSARCSERKRPLSRRRTRFPPNALSIFNVTWFPLLTATLVIARHVPRLRHPKRRSYPPSSGFLQKAWC